MIPSTVTLTFLAFAIILAASGAPLLLIYITGGCACLWQVMVALAAGTWEAPLVEPESED